MVLDHVAQRAGLLIVASPCAHADVLCGRDLHAVHILAVPDGFEYAVRKAKHEDVLHRFLAQVMVDAICLVFPKVGDHHFVERQSRFEVTTERLLYDNARPRAAVGVFARQSGSSQVLNDAHIITGGRGEVVDPVAAGAALDIILGQRFLDLLVGFGTMVIGREVVDAARKSLPRRRFQGGTGLGERLA